MLDQGTLATESSAAFSCGAATFVTPSAARRADALGHCEVRRGLAALRPELFACAMRLARSRARAEDLVQTAMLRAIRFEAQFRAGTNLRAWAFQVLRSVFLTECRKQKRERRACERMTLQARVAESFEPKEPMRSLSVSAERALAGLPSHYRRVVELVDLEELGYREAARRLEVPLGTVMSRLHRGRRLLAEKLPAAP